MGLYNTSDRVYIELKINDKELVTDWTNLVYFKMTEYSGLALTYFDCCFRTFNKEIADLVVTNNKVKAVIGDDPNSADTFEISIATENKDNGGVENQYMVTFSGVVGNPRFLIDTKSEFYYGTSIDVIKQFYNLYLRNKVTDNIVSDIESKEYSGSLTDPILTQEELEKVNRDNLKEQQGKVFVQETPMTWYRTNQAGNMFLADVWLHMNVYPSFPLLAIDKYNNLIIKDYYKLQMSEPKWIFVGNEKLANTQENTLLYLNNFNVKSYKEMSNVYSGYGKVVSVSNADSGSYGIFSADTSKSLLANSQTTEGNDYGTQIIGATVNSGNVYSGYQETYFHNASQLVNLSSYEGMLQLAGKYYKELTPLDLVNITYGTSYRSIEGKYLIDTIETIILPNQPIQTKVYVSRDNLNNLEDSLNEEELRNQLKITPGQKGALLQVLKDLRIGVSFARNVVDGVFLNSIISYIKDVKYSVLSNFKVFGTYVDLNSKGTALNSLIRVANNLANVIIDKVLPAPYNNMFHDILLYNRPSSIKACLSKLVDYLPADVQDIVSNIFSLLAESSSLMQHIRDKNNIKAQENNVSIATRSNGQQVQFTETPEGITQMSITEDNTIMANTTNQNEQRVEEAINEKVAMIEEKTNGVDIPIPIIDLTDSEKLLNSDKIQDLVVDDVMENLKERGYLDNLSDDEIAQLDSILRNPDPDVQIDFNLINKINNAIGKQLYTRFWGTFNSLIELTNFYIENSFKDTYKTIGTIKLVNATGGKRLFMAIPTNQVSNKLRFYINNVNMTNKIGASVDTNEHPMVQTYLNVTDKNGELLQYTVFYTDDKYNSNSVTFEVRQV